MENARLTYGGTKGKHVQITLDPVLLDDLDIMARRDGVSRSRFIALSLEDTMNARREELEATRKFFGSVVSR